MSHSNGMPKWSWAVLSNQRLSTFFIILDAVRQSAFHYSGSVLSGSSLTNLVKKYLYLQIDQLNRLLVWPRRVLYGVSVGAVFPNCTSELPTSTIHVHIQIYITGSSYSEHVTYVLREFSGLYLCGYTFSFSIYRYRCELEFLSFFWW